MNTTMEENMKTLHNSDVAEAKAKVSDLKVFGDGDLWVLLAKASSQKEGWMKSTKAMEIPGVGCLVQVTTQQGDSVAEAVTFVPNVVIYEVEHIDDEGSRIERCLMLPEPYRGIE